MGLAHTLARLLIHRVDVKTSAETQDALGGLVRTPLTTLASAVPCRIQPLASATIERRQQIEGRTVTHQVTFAGPLTFTLDSRCRLQFGTRVFDVQHVIDGDEIDQVVECECRERQA